MPIRKGTTEAGVLGAAMLAGLSTGAFASAEEAVCAWVKRDRTFEPDARRHEIYREKHALFQELYPTLKPILGKL